MSAFVTVGVDLATDPRKTAAVRLRWEGKDVSFARDDVVFPGSDTAIEALADPADILAVDVPLGWPSAWADGVAGHRPGLDFLPDQGTTAELTWRETDRWVHGRTGKAPQRVAASWLGATAIRGARLNARLARAGWKVNPLSDEVPARSVVETYPAALMALWFPRASQVEDGRSRRQRVVAGLPEAGLVIDGDLERIIEIDHVYDGMLAAIAAGATWLGLSPSPPSALAEAATREGWIRLPVDHELSEFVAELSVRRS